MADERGLELDLTLNVDEFEAELAKVDTDTQKVMRQLQSNLKVDNLKFDIEITGAKASGDEVKAYQLELEKLNHTYKAQEAVVNGLKKRLNELNSEDQKNETLIKQVSNLLDVQTLKLNKQAVAIKKKQDAHEASIEAAKKAAQAEIEAAEKAAQAEAKAEERIKAQAQKEAERLAIIKKTAEEQAKIQAASDAKMSRQLSTENVDLGFRFDIKQAENAGQYIKAYKLEAERLNAVFKAQEQQAKVLNDEIDKQSKLTGKDSLEVKQLTNELLKTKNAMADTQAQIKSLNAGFIDKIVSGISKISPAFANVIQSVKEYKAEIANYKDSLSNIGSMSIGQAAAGGAIAGLGVAVGAVSLAATGLKAVHSEIDDIATSAAQATEPVYLLAERFEMTYEDASKLNGVFRIDGTNADVFAKSVQRLNKQLLSGNAGEAAKMLEKYNVSLRNADGTQKSYIEQTKALADGYKKAKEQGEGLDYITNTLGSGGSQFVHLLNGFDDYLEKYKEANEILKINYQLNHELLDQKKAMKLAEEQLAAVQGQAYVPAVVAGIKTQEALMKQRVQTIQENNDKMQEFQKQLAIVEVAYARMTQGFGAMWDAIKEKAVAGLSWLAKFADISNTVEQEATANLAETKQNTEQQKQKQAAKEQTQLLEKQAEEQKKVADKIHEAYSRIGRELRDLGSDEYTKQVNRLKDEVEANIKAGVDELTAWDAYYQKKDELDKRQSEQAQKRLEEEAKKQTDLIEKRKQAELSISQVFMTETQKRISAIQRQKDEWVRAGADEVRATQAAQKQINEARMSEVEKAVQDYKKLAQYIETTKKQGKYNENDVARYAERLQFERAGFSQRDVSNVASVGIDALRQLMETARAKILEPLTGSMNMFQQQKEQFGFFNKLPEMNQMAIPSVQAEQQKTFTINSPITISFDNTVVEDVSSLQKIADKVASVIQPAIETALRGENYVY